MKLSDHETARRIMRAMAKRARTEISKMRPESRIGTVTAINPGDNSCRVIYPNDSQDFEVQMGAARPYWVGQRVYVARNQRGHKRVEDVIGDALINGTHSVEAAGPLTSINDSDLFQIAIDISISINKVLKLRPGVMYRFHDVDPTGAVIDARGAFGKVPDGVVAQNMFNASGPWTLIGGDFDGNKAFSTDPGVATNGNGIYQYAATGWDGEVRLLDAPVFHHFWWSGVSASVDTSLFTDALNAPAAAFFTDRLETHHNDGIGQKYTGLGGLTQYRPSSHDNGSHGIRTFLCDSPVSSDVVANDNPDGHGFTSLYCINQKVDGQFNNNGTDGLVFGGDTTSTINAPGRRMQVLYAECNGNGNHGLVFDASITASDDPVVVEGQVGMVIANSNDNDGVIVTSSQYVHFNQLHTDSNGAHGASFASRNVSFDFHHAHLNGQKPLALQGGSTAPNWGDHVVGTRDYGSNTPDDGIVIGDVLAANTWIAQLTATEVPPEPDITYSVHKPTDTARNSTVAMVADPDLSFAAVDVGFWDFFCYLAYDAPTTADLAISMNLPTGATINWTGDGPSGTSTSGNPATLNRNEFTGATGPVLGGVGVGSGVVALVRGIIHITDAGFVGLKWAQNTSDPGNTTLHALSFMKMTKIF